MSNETSLRIQKICFVVNVCSLLYGVFMGAPLGIIFFVSLAIVWCLCWIKYYTARVELDKARASI